MVSKAIEAMIAMKGGMGRNADQLEPKCHVEHFHNLSTLTSKFSYIYTYI